jgi:hypothetical protein
MKPWLFDMEGCGTSHGLPIITKANGHLVAHLCERSIKNARLIAAAPELLACVEGFVKSWGKEVERDDDINGSDAIEWISGAMLEFRIALAKARGQP